MWKRITWCLGWSFPLYQSILCNTKFLVNNDVDTVEVISDYRVVSSLYWVKYFGVQLLQILVLLSAIFVHPANHSVSCNLKFFIKWEWYSSYLASYFFCEINCSTWHLLQTSIYLFIERQSYREGRDRNLPFVGSLPKWPKWLVQGQSWSQVTGA